MKPFFSISKSTLLVSLVFVLFWQVQAQVVDTLAVRKEVDSLIQVCQTHIDKKKYDEANLIIDLVINKSGKGDAMPLQYSKIMSKRGKVVFEKDRDFKEAEKSYLIADSVWVSIYGELNEGRVFNLYRIGVLNHSYLYNDIKAEEYHLKYINIIEKTSGIDNPDYLYYLEQLGYFYHDSGENLKSESAFIKACNVAEKKTETGSKEHIYLLGRLTAFYEATRQYEKQVAIFEKIMAVGREKGMLGTGEFIGFLNDMGLAYINLGQYEKSVGILEESARLSRALFGPKSEIFAMNRQNIANAYTEMGDYERAEEHMSAAMSILKEMSDQNSEKYAYALGDYGMICSLTGQFKKAENFLEKSISILAGIGLDENENSLILRAALAEVYFESGQWNLADSLASLCVHLGQKKAEFAPVNFVESTNLLARINYKRGNFKASEKLFERAKSIWEESSGQYFTRCAIACTYLANVNHKLDRLNKADSLYLEAGRILEMSVNKSHFAYAGNLHHYALFKDNIQQFVQADSLFREAHFSQQSMLLKATRYLSDRELINYIKTFTQTLDQYFSSVFDRPPAFRSEFINQLSYNKSLIYKGFLLQTAGEIKRRAYLQSEVRDSAILLASFYRRLNQELAGSPTERDSNRISEMENNIDVLEKQIAKSVAGYTLAFQPVDWRQIGDRLQPDQAAVEFVTFRYHKAGQPTDSILYAALILRSGDKAPHFVALCEERQLQSVLRASPKGSLKDQMETFFQNTYYYHPDKPSLYDLVWKPIEIYLSRIKTVYVAPDGLLHRIHLGAIRDPQGAYLNHRFKLVQLGSTRRLVEPIEFEFVDKSIILIGGVQYEIDSSKMASVISGLPQKLDKTRDIHFSVADTLRGGIFDYLPATDAEVDYIGSLCQKNGFHVTKYKRLEASEEAIKAALSSYVLMNGKGQSAPSPRVLHFATHGFFFPDAEKDALHDDLHRGEQIFRINDDPMRRAGLILAGANHAWKTGRPFRPDAEDGILTAAEIRDLNLSNTELVVLSACDTGLGDLVGNEGVFGLQRAFKIAGAKYLLMSLWSVPDKATQELMDAFYENWLDKKMDIPEAFRAAQAKIRREYPSPYYWAGFVLLQ